jgi:hypothetical protein
VSAGKSWGDLRIEGGGACAINQTMVFDPLQLAYQLERNVNIPIGNHKGIDLAPHKLINNIITTLRRYKIERSMSKILRTSALALAAATAGVVAAPDHAQAQTYQIDCAILLCLSGGWPASVPCARARAEFIRRITPWPVEPPLQIWRCPMGAAYTIDPDTLTADRIYEILLDMNDAPSQSYPSVPLTDTSLMAQPAVMRRSGGSSNYLPEGFALQLVQEGGADIDISGAEFNFVRSIRVYNVTYARQSEGRDDCNRSFSMRVGTYGTQGDFNWNGTNDHRSLPAAHTGLEGFPSNCPTIWHRSVFVDWQDYQGNYGFEQVNY